ncbi:MAG: hypothetical protein ABDH63_04020 [Candidatus Caldarchaeales archaeon]
MASQQGAKRYVARLEVESGVAADVVSEVLRRFGRSVTGVFVGGEAGGSREVYVELECEEVVLAEFVEILRRRGGVSALTVRGLEGLMDFASPWRRAL